MLNNLKLQNVLIRLKYCTFLIALSILVSCIPNKRIIYLQNEETNYPNDSLIAEAYSEYSLQSGDNLNVEVYSSNQELVAVFDKNSQVNANAGARSGGDINYVSGYLIDLSGNLELPVVGKIPVQGLTLEQCKDTVESRIRNFIVDAVVTIRLSGIRFTTIGSVGKTGMYSVLASRLNIVQALALSGDLPTIADRKEVLILREFPGGVKTYEVDLTDRSLLTSPLYFIHPGDIIYVKPLPIRQVGKGFGETGLQSFSTIISTVSSAFVLFFTLNRL